MSRSRAGEPVFRLHMAYPQFRVEREGEPAGVIPVDAPDRDARLAALGERVSAEGGRLVAVLPEAEVWRARIAGRPSASRLRAAAAAALGTERVVVVQGPPNPEGRPIAALRRSTLIETQAFLATAGLRPDAVTGTGSFPGFKAPPEFDPRGPRLPLPSAPMAAGLVTAAALLLTVAIQPDPIRPAPPIEIAVAPTPEPAAAEPLAVTEVAIPAPPRARPADFTALVPRTPAPIREAAVLPAPTVAFAARNLPPEVQAAVSGALREQAQPRVAVLLEDGSVPAPRRRPAGTAPGTQQAALPTMTDAAPEAASLGPRPRPAAVPAASSAADPAASTDAVPAASATNAPTVGGPRPRPAARASTDALLAAAIGAAVADAQTSVPEPVRVAALGPGPDATITAAPAPVVAPPEPRRATAPLRAAPVQPQQVVRPVAAAPVVRATPVQPAPVRAVAAPVAKPPAVTRTAAAPVRVASVQPAATPPRTARQETARPGSVALIGVFGRTDQRHALLRLGNGSTERVRAGDRVAGMQVAGIGSDSVRLAGGGRETVLRLPE